MAAATACALVCAAATLAIRQRRRHGHLPRVGPPAHAPSIVLEKRIAGAPAGLYARGDGGLYALPADAIFDGFEAFAASEAALAGFRARGYVLIRGGFSPATTDAARAELEALIKEKSPAVASVYYEGEARRLLVVAGHDVEQQQQQQQQQQNWKQKLHLGSVARALPDALAAAPARWKLVRKVMGFLHSGYPALLATAEQRGLVRAAEAICGGAVSLFQDMAMVKPPAGREKPWHQDHAYFNIALEQPVLGVWVALSEVTEHNGCMVVAPVPPSARGPRSHFMRRDWQICDSEVTAGRLAGARTPVPMRPGDVLLFDSLLAHGTDTNRSADHRWALQYHFKNAGCRSTADDVPRLVVFGGEGRGATC